MYVFNLNSRHYDNTLTTVGACISIAGYYYCVLHDCPDPIPAPYWVHISMGRYSKSVNPKYGRAAIGAERVIINPIIIQYEVKRFTGA